MQLKCNQCRKQIEPGKGYRNQLNVLCEGCYMTRRRPRTRKTHWQYLGSIKTEYLIPGKKDLPIEN